MLVTAARRNLYTDAFNEAVFEKPGVFLTRALVYLDNRGIDGLVNGLAAGVGGGSGRLRRLQTGFVRSYAMSVLAGAVLVLAAFLAVQAEMGSFDRFVWEFVGGRPRQNRWRTIKEVPSRTPESDALSRVLKARGFTFVGSTICYAFMQAVGMVNDHLVDCARYRKVMK